MSVTHSRIPVGAGSFSPDEITAAFAALPLDLTFVDAEGIVRYFSEYRIFSRPPECLGQHVLECHSESSRPGIKRLLSEFAEGWRDEAAFVARKDGREVGVHYIAMRGFEGEYLGCLEIAQWAPGNGNGSPQTPAR